MNIPPDVLPQEKGALDVSLDVIAGAVPDAGPEMLGLRAGGWEFTDACAQYGGGSDGDGVPIADTLVRFRKKFVTGSAASVSADARGCGVTVWSNPSFFWEDGSRGPDDDASWELTGEP